VLYNSISVFFAGNVIFLTVIKVGELSIRFNVSIRAVECKWSGKQSRQKADANGMYWSVGDKKSSGVWAQREVIRAATMH